jgi:hypothetical protein
MNDSKADELKTLKKNRITSFILRFDLHPSSADFAKVINELGKVYDRLERRAGTKISFNLSGENSGVKSTEATDFILVHDEKKYRLSFANDWRTICFEAKSYIDRSTYVEPISQLHGVLSAVDSELMTTRIGMRFVNEFDSGELKNTSKVFIKDVANQIIKACSKDYVSRFIAQEMYNYNSDYKLKVQYGILNKYYPAILNNYDLYLDIDAFDNIHHSLSEWPEVLDALNHAAYNKFLEFMLPKYLEGLK